MDVILFPIEKMTKDIHLAIEKKKRDVKLYLAVKLSSKEAKKYKFDFLANGYGYVYVTTRTIHKRNNQEFFFYKGIKCYIN